MNSVDKVTAICKQRKIAISRLEQDLGFSNGYVRQLKKGVFPADRLIKIANYLGVTVDYLMDEEPVKDSSVCIEADNAHEIIPPNLSELVRHASLLSDDRIELLTKIAVGLENDRIKIG
jgi:transcriptional regulator with XRE-family HTH domain